MGTTASKAVSIVNQGTTAVNVSQINVSGQAFSLSGEGNLPVTVAAGGTYSVNVNFVPTGIGAATGQLTIASNAATNGTLVIGLSGTGTETTVGATPSPVLTSLSCASNGATGSAIDTCTVDVELGSGQRRLRSQPFQQRLCSSRARFSNRGRGIDHRQLYGHYFAGELSADGNAYRERERYC